MDIYYNPVTIYQGNRCIRELKKVMLNMQNCRTVLLLVWSPEVFQNEDIKQLIRTNEIQFRPFCFTRSNPDLEDLYEIYEETKDWEIDLIVSIGGGTVMDLGKSLCCLYGSGFSSKQELREMIKKSGFQLPSCQWIGVSTTAGTGSEVTCWATIWDREQEEKLSLECRSNYAAAAFEDPQFALTMPVALKISSALDAAAHAIEAYWAKNSNFVSRAFSLEALPLIIQPLDQILENDPTACSKFRICSAEKEKEELKKERLLHACDLLKKGSMLAGLAFSNTKTTACHSLSYPLTLRYGIPHGTAVAMLLAPVMQINQEVLEEPERLYRAAGISGAGECRRKVEDFLQRAGIPHRLRDWGVSQEDLPKLVAHGFTKGRIDNNPVDLKEDMLYWIYKSIY